MKAHILSLAAVTLLTGTTSTLSAADEGFAIFSDLTLKGEVRPRYEAADVKDNGVTGADALTARTTLGINATLFEVDHLSTYLELTSVNTLGLDNYNDTSGNNVGVYDIIVDPQQARMTQAYIDYKTGPALFRVGRQMINLDNQRFVGAVGWRQMFQTFDAATLVVSPVEKLDLTATYLNGVNTVKEIQVPAKTNSVLLNGSYAVMEPLKVTAYAYLLSNIRYQGTQLYNGSNTYGVAVSGKIAAGSNVTLDYRAEYAKQTDPSLSYGTFTKPTNIDADYYNLDIGANIIGIIAGVDYEVLGANGDDTAGPAFATPLATGHKFNGWADIFLTTPTGGLKDANVRLGYGAKGLGKLLAVYHDFRADKAMPAATGTSSDLGTELDLLYANAIPGVQGLSGLIKYAGYKQGEVTGYTNDVEKFWVQLDYKF